MTCLVHSNDATFLPKDHTTYVYIYRYICNLYSYILFYLKQNVTVKQTYKTSIELQYSDKQTLNTPYKQNAHFRQWCNGYSAQVTSYFFAVK